MCNYAIFYLVKEGEYESVYVFANITRISNRRINTKTGEGTKREARLS